MQDITPFSEGDSQRRICKSFASGVCDALCSDHIFASKEVLSAVLLVDVNLGRGSFTTSTQIDALFKIQISLLQQASSKSVVVYPENNVIP